VSNGASGTISNNVLLTFPAPTANWGTIVEFAVFDAETGGESAISRSAHGEPDHQQWRSCTELRDFRSHLDHR
jgi:hypothetical protein